MDSCCSKNGDDNNRQELLDSESDFGFAFNDSNFSDRILRIEIIPDLPESKSDGEGCSTIADWARHRKRRREEIKRENGSFANLQFFLV